MNLPVKLIKIGNALPCHLIRRLNRFVVMVEIKAIERKASINNTGKLEEFLISGREGFCTRNEKPGKTDYRLFAIADKGQAALIDTRLQMHSFETALSNGLIPWLEGYRMVGRDAPFSDSLFDYLFEKNGESVYVEVKSAVLRDGDCAMYPDCPTARGRRHIRELTDYAISGGKAFIVFIAALPEVSAFKPYRKGDPELCELLVRASHAGVEIRAIQIAYDPDDRWIQLKNPDLKVTLS